MAIIVELDGSVIQENGSGLLKRHAVLPLIDSILPLIPRK